MCLVPKRAEKVRVTLNMSGTCSTITYSRQLLVIPTVLIFSSLLGMSFFSKVVSRIILIEDVVFNVFLTCLYNFLIVES